MKWFAQGRTAVMASHPTRLYHGSFCWTSLVALGFLKLLFSWMTCVRYCHRVELNCGQVWLKDAGGSFPVDGWIFWRLESGLAQIKTHGERKESRCGNLPVCEPVCVWLGSCKGRGEVGKWAHAMLTCLHVCVCVCLYIDIVCLYIDIVPSIFFSPSLIGGVAWVH